MDQFSNIVQTIAVFAIPVLFAISLHEAAHGYTARYFGDPTAENAGRLSLNPIRHIDLFGTVLLPLMLALSPLHIAFGYAKPVPVDFSRLRNPKKQMAFVALAGPMANFAMGLGWMLLGMLLISGGVVENFPHEMVRAGVLVNAAMCVFNLIPIPPLDGGRILTAMLPMEFARPFARLELYSNCLFIGLIAASYFHLLDGLLLGAMRILIKLQSVLMTPISFLLS